MTLLVWQRIVMVLFGLALLDVRREDDSTLETVATIFVKLVGVACILAAIIGRLP